MYDVFGMDFGAFCCLNFDKNINGAKYYDKVATIK